MFFLLNFPFPFWLTCPLAISDDQSILTLSKEVSSQKQVKNLVSHGAPGSHQLQCHLPTTPGHDCTLSQDLQLCGGPCPTRTQQPNAPCLLSWSLSDTLSPWAHPCPARLLVGPASSVLEGFISMVYIKGLFCGAQYSNCHSCSSQTTGWES